MARLTRAQSQDRTREQLLLTARRLFLRDGFAATSLERVAEEAGYSKGAVYSNFRSKDELCLAVLDRIHAEQAEQITAAIAAAGSDDDRLSALQRWAETNIGDEAWTSLEIEFTFSARRNQPIREGIAERGNTIRHHIANLVVASARTLDVELPLPPETIATLLLSLGIGLAVQRVINPSIPVTALMDTIQLLQTGHPHGKGPFPA